MFSLTLTTILGMFASALFSIENCVKVFFTTYIYAYNIVIVPNLNKKKIQNSKWIVSNLLDYVGFTCLSKFESFILNSVNFSLSNF